MNWQSAFLAQARAEYAILQMLIGHEDVPVCHKLHYLQMVSEKVAKGLSTAPDSKPPPVHRALVRFIQSAADVKTLMRACGFVRRSAYRSYLRSMLPLADQIERLAPESSARQPNPEYPWQPIGGDDPIVPADHGFPEFDFRNRDMLRLLSFPQICLQLS